MREMMRMREESIGAHLVADGQIEEFIGIGQSYHRHSDFLDEFNEIRGHGRTIVLIASRSLDIEKKMGIVVEFVGLSTLTIVMETIDGDEFHLDESAITSDHVRSTTHMELIDCRIALMYLFSIERCGFLERCTHTSTDATEV